jgi:hypothetical protein
MPYEPDTASEKHREGEREVRYTIIRLIRDRLREPRTPITWCGRDLDFSNATFDGGDFRGAKFISGEVSFFGAEFAAGLVSFVGAEFTGGRVSFLSAKFTGGEVSFNDAKFTGGAVFFNDAEFTGGAVSFDDAEYTSGKVSFDDTKYDPGCSITWGRPFEPPAAWTALQEGERRQDEPRL